MRTTAILVLAATMVAASVPASAERLSGPEIKRAVEGKRIWLATPPWGEFPLNYRRGGVVDGSGEALGLGRVMAPTDRGRWWVDGNRLCQRWTEWYEGQTFCFTLARAGGNNLRWVRDDGFSGTARIGN